MLLAEAIGGLNPFTFDINAAEFGDAFLTNWPLRLNFYLSIGQLVSGTKNCNSLLHCWAYYWHLNLIQRSFVWLARIGCAWCVYYNVRFDF
mgnify:FL=1